MAFASLRRLSFFFLSMCLDLNQAFIVARSKSILDLVEYALLQQRRLKYLSLQHICFLAQTKWVLRQPTIIPALGMGIVSLIPTKWDGENAQQYVRA